jgi:ATP-dependent RNA helicase SUPV3L1/SUV3
MSNVMNSQNPKNQTGIAQPRSKEIQAKNDAEWKACVPLCGDVVRPGSRKSQIGRLYVIARTYSEELAAKRLSLPLYVIRNAVIAKDLPSFKDPDRKTRIPASVIESALTDSEKLDIIAQHTIIKAREISLVANISYAAARGRLQSAQLSTTKATWKQVQGIKGLPKTLKEFTAILDACYPAWLESVLKEKHEKELFDGQIYHEQSKKKWKESNLLRQQLLDVFPTWEIKNRTEQHIAMHLGPTNSGKTFSGLKNLIDAGSGWYLSPLRLLAHEVYDTLNMQGVPCNLLTGEESARVEGAKITAATIEMFSPHMSGECVIIDEAHMLADPQRGWAWTRAIMETNAPNIHIIGSPIAESLIRNIGDELGFSIETENYTRLTPLEAVEQPWSLTNLPPKTILVAFSRRMVLGLKAELEKKHHRSVSVVYGNLPPEVRLRQADRFSNGDTELCVATDAIGMGLNLPADNVCFYETSKYDGTRIRTLTANEINQIGGRAGRYGLSKYGKVGALNKQNLRIIRNALNAPFTPIQYAYVAPEPESLALLPGSLAEKLARWVALNGIPERWRQLLKTVDLSEQIDLAKKLSQDDIDKIGEKSALRLTNAPVANNTEIYWLKCARAIINGIEMPVNGNDISHEIKDADDLEAYEFSIRCADIYLWLAQRKEFSQFGSKKAYVKTRREKLSIAVDEALMKKIDTTRRCSSCGKPLALDYRYNICKTCYYERRYEDQYEFGSRSGTNN